MEQPEIKQTGEAKQISTENSIKKSVDISENVQQNQNILGSDDEQNDNVSVHRSITSEQVQQEQEQQQEQQESVIQQDQDQTSSALAEHQYFCKVCRKIVSDRCEEDHEDSLVPKSQLEQDFKKYKVYSEQNDPIYNVQKGLNKIQEAIQHINIQQLQQDYHLKTRVFKDNSKITDFLGNIVYKNNKLLIDDLHLLPNLDELRRESYLIDIIKKNYDLIKVNIYKANQIEYDHNNYMRDAMMPKSGLSRHQSVDHINIKRKSYLSCPNDSEDIEQTPTPVKLQKLDEKNASVIKQDESEDEGKLKRIQSVSKDKGLEYMSQKEKEILETMHNTNYEKHHHFTDQQKKLFAKFCLLRKIKDGITVSVTTEQWKLNRITVQIWIDKYKKMINSKSEG